MKQTLYNPKITKKFTNLSDADDDELRIEHVNFK